MELLDPVKDLFGGGTLTPILIGGGLLALYVASKVVKLALRLVALGVAGVLFLGTAPFASAEVDGPVAACASRAVEDALASWQVVTTKRITVEELSSDAACAAGDTGLSAGTATVKTRTFYDVPTQTWLVTPAGATAERFG